MVEIRGKHIIFCHYFTSSFSLLQTNVNCFIFLRACWLGCWFESEDILGFYDFNSSLDWVIAFCSYAKDLVFDFSCNCFITWCVVISLVLEKVEVRQFCYFISDFELLKQQSFVLKYWYTLKWVSANLREIEVPGNIIFTSEVKHICQCVNCVRTKLLQSLYCFKWIEFS